MLVIVDCTNEGFPKENVDVDPSATVEDLITLLTVQNSHLDFDRVRIIYNGQALQRAKKLLDMGIRDGYEVELQLANSDKCCSTF